MKALRSLRHRNWPFQDVNTERRVEVKTRNFIAMLSPLNPSINKQMKYIDTACGERSFAWAFTNRFSSRGKHTLCMSNKQCTWLVFNLHNLCDSWFHHWWAMQSSQSWLWKPKYLRMLLSVLKHMFHDTSSAVVWHTLSITLGCKCCH